MSIDLTVKDGSDNGSGTQSSWSKRIVEVDSSQAKSVWDKLPNPRDNALARKEHVTQDDKEKVEMGKDLEIGVPNRSSFDVQDANKKSTAKFCESKLNKLGDNLDISMQIGCENGGSGTQAHGQTKITNGQTEALPKANQLLKNINIEDDNNNNNNNNKSIYYSKESPTLELSLKRPRDVEDAEAGGQDRNVLRHSGVSAFSRYNTVSNINQAPTGIVGSCSPLDISSEAANADNIQSNSNGNPNHPSNGSDDMGSTTNNAFTTKPDDKPVPNGSTIAVQRNVTSTLQPLEPVQVDTVKAVAGQTKGSQQVQVRHHHHHYHHHHHHVHKLQQQNAVNPDTVSNILTASAEGNAANFGSASGSNNKSNGENGGSWLMGNGSAPVAEVVKIGSDNGVAGKCDGSGSGSGRGSGVDQERLTQREAALNKFRQKRKERCFEKKVRYQSRKKLAEQRPRVRGQFVRHGANGVNNEDADS
ncbi:hypothetical protein L2E82_07458 [Cichorium intybus]|uniref:Uncharacterized protein n=1 Tax=Cichorium intybus TaxID=13427 RepID=A0ACB9G4C4_CICIN|nr:hypothetical protein L2E82_07458 [Cichorium intybus]